MREIRDLKGNVIYRIEGGMIIPESPSDMITIHQTIRDGRASVSRSKSIKN